jgi:hypothetical protein
MPETTRRGFLGLIAGAVALPFVPRPDEPAAVTPDSFVGYNHPTESLHDALARGSVFGGVYYLDRDLHLKDTDCVANAYIDLRGHAIVVPEKSLAYFGQNYLSSMQKPILL